MEPDETDSVEKLIENLTTRPQAYGDAVDYMLQAAAALQHYYSQYGDSNVGVTVEKVRQRKRG